MKIKRWAMEDGSKLRLRAGVEVAEDAAEDEVGDSEKVSELLGRD